MAETSELSALNTRLFKQGHRKDRRKDEIPCLTKGLSVHLLSRDMRLKAPVVSMQIRGGQRTGRRDDRKGDWEQMEASDACVSSDGRQRDIFPIFRMSARNGQVMQDGESLRLHAWLHSMCVHSNDCQVCVTITSRSYIPHLFTIRLRVPRTCSSCPFTPESMFPS